jgi:hypothetical protein
MSDGAVNRWPILTEDEFERELNEQLFAEVNDLPPRHRAARAQGSASKIVFELLKWLRRIDSVDWRRPTKLRSAVGLVTAELLRQLTTAGRAPSEFDEKLRRKLNWLIAEEVGHRQQIAAKAKQATPHGSAGCEAGAEVQRQEKEEEGQEQTLLGA